MHLSDFAPTKCVKKHLDRADTDIIITGKALCDMLKAAERAVACEPDTDDEASLPSEKMKWSVPADLMEEMMMVMTPMIWKATMPARVIR